MSEKKTIDARLCRDCGMSLKPGQEICPYCGERNPTIPDSQAPLHQVNSPHQVMAEPRSETSKPLASPARITTQKPTGARSCWKCGMVLYSGQLLCPNCGESQVPDSWRIATQNAFKFCMNCGDRCDADLANCPACKQSIIASKIHRIVATTPPRDSKRSRNVAAFFVLVLLGFEIAYIISALNTLGGYYLYLVGYYTAPSIILAILFTISIILLFSKKIVMVKDVAIPLYISYFGITRFFLIFYPGIFFAVIVIFLNILFSVTNMFLRTGPWLVPPTTIAEIDNVRGITAQARLKLVKQLAQWKGEHGLIDIDAFVRANHVEQFFLRERLERLTRKHMLIGGGYYQGKFLFDKLGIEAMNAASSPS
jgi:RNA polymerase subunit RPABC4/transcription elongation factor Spt4